jgi:hypothetical protein
LIQPKTIKMRKTIHQILRYCLPVTAALGFGATVVSAQILDLWSINFAGNESTGNIITVADGTTLAPVGSFGGNQWNNIIAPVRDPYTPDSPLSMNNSSGANPISFTWVESGNAGHHFDRTAGLPETGDISLFEGYFGRGGFDTTLQFSDLNASAVYDVYVYFTWGWGEDPVDYSITAGTAAGALSTTLTPDRATATHGDMVEGNNYAIFSGISPDGTGAIHLNAVSSDGGFSGVQLVQVPEPSTYAVILGGLFLAFALWRRRK